MRIVSIVYAAALAAALAATASQAEAKGRRAFGGVWTAAHAAVPIRTTLPAGASPALPMPVEAPQAGPVPVPGSAPVQGARPVIREAVAAAPWCARGRVFGSGAGFCEIN